MGVLKTDGGATLFSKRMFQGASRLLFALVAEPKFDSGLLATRRWPTEALMTTV